VHKNFGRILTEGLAGDGGRKVNAVSSDLPCVHWPHGACGSNRSRICLGNLVALGELNSMERINALISCQKSPFNPLAFPAWSFSAISLTVIAALANFMTVIIIFSPGALSITAGTEILPCTVRVPDVALAHIGSMTSPVSNVLSFAIRAVIQGYLPPFRQYNQTGYFDVDYVAPAHSCVSTTNSVDFRTVLPTNILCSTALDCTSRLRWSRMSRSTRRKLSRARLSARIIPFE